MPANLENSAVATGLKKVWTGKGQFSFQSQRKSMPKNAHTIHTVKGFGIVNKA